jgi:ABC-2 type transport system permease protein
MNLRIIRTLVAKDLSLYFRNRFFAGISIALLLVYIAVYYVMPGTTEQRFSIAIFPANVPAEVQHEFEIREMEVTPFDDENAMRAAVEAGDYRVGVVLPEDVMTTMTAGTPTQIRAYYPPGIPTYLNEAFNDLLMIVFNNISYTFNGQPLNIERHEEVLGYDLAGKALAPRDRMLPMFAVLLFMMETLGLANLIAEEIQRGTLRALLITPMNVRDLFAGKSITGISLGLAQAVVLMLVTGKLGIHPLLILTTLLLGALLVTGVGFLIASVARDMMSVISWGMLAIILLGIPSVSIMFPGTISDWVRVIPSFYLVDTLHRVVNFGAGWNEVVPNLVILLACSAVLLTLGASILGRKLQ